MEEDLPPPLEDCSEVLKKNTTRKADAVKNGKTNIGKLFDEDLQKPLKLVEGRSKVSGKLRQESSQSLKKLTKDCKNAVDEAKSPDDLLVELITRDPSLSTLMSDQGFVEAIQLFITNTKEAMKKYENHSVYRPALQKFAGVLGDYFDALGEKQTEVTQEQLKERVSIDKNLPQNEQELLARVFKDENVQILVDPLIQQLLQAAQTGNSQAVQQILR